MHVPTPEELIAKAEQLEAEIGKGRIHEALITVTQNIDHEIRMLSERLWESQQAAAELVDQRRAALQEHYSERYLCALRELSNA